jgi:hypothetical protein
MAGGRSIPVSLQRLPVLGPLERTRPGEPPAFEVDLENCTSFVGFSYSDRGWNPHVTTLREYTINRHLTYEDSSLCRLHTIFKPATLQELFLEDADHDLEPLCSLPPTRELFRYVWAINQNKIRNVGPLPQLKGHHYFGPLSQERGRKEFDRLIRTFRSIEQDGFRPDVFGPLRGYFMIDGSRHRFVVGAGNHRLAALRVLGYSTVRVGLNTSHPAVVQRSRLDSWTVESGGPFQGETAYALFDKLMNEDGLDKARNVGALGVRGEVIGRAS